MCMRWEVSLFSVDNFLSHSAEKFRGGSLQGFRKFSVSKNFRHNRGEGYYDSPLKIFCLTVPKIFVGEPILVSENFWSRNLKINLKKIGTGWDSNPDLSFQKPVVLPTVPWEQLQIPTNVSEIVKISDTAEIRTGPTASERCCPKPTAVIYF